MKRALRKIAPLLIVLSLSVGIVSEAIPLTQPKQTYKRRATVPLELRIFIPLDNIGNPAEAYTTVFEADNPRSVRDTNSYRCRQVVSVIPVQSLSVDGLKPGNIENLIGVTRKYDPATSLDEFNYLIAAARADMVKGLPMMLDYDVASNADMHITAARLSARKVKVSLQGAAANPLVPPLVVPAIDWDINVEIDATDPARPKYTVTGEHDGFPSYELYIFGQKVYSYYPANPGSLTAPAALLPPMDITANSSGDIE